MTSSPPDREFVVAESADGYSIHPPGSTDEQIASGDAQYLISEPWPDTSHIVPPEAFNRARELLIEVEAEAELDREIFQHLERLYGKKDEYPSEAYDAALNAALDARIAKSPPRERTQRAPPRQRLNPTRRGQ